ncbi:hypothetical protein [Epibacterium ulvae]|nr:hypothetical protein [Epibacterium ulvae]
MAFDPKNITHRKQLYPVLKALADQDPHKGPLDVLDDAMGHLLSRGTDYLSNMRKGQYATSIAARLHKWITEHHADLGRMFAAGLFPEAQSSAWDAFLERYATRGKLRLVKFKPSSLGLVERTRQTSKPDDTIKLGEKFCFQLECEDDRYVRAFQIYKGEWHPIPVGANEAMGTTITARQKLVPVLADGTPDPLVEQHDLGPHQFVVLASQSGDFPDFDTQPTASETLEWHVLRVQVESA